MSLQEFQGVVFVYFMHQQYNYQRNIKAEIGKKSYLDSIGRC